MANKYGKASANKVSEDRLRLGNQYAHLNEYGEQDAIVQIANVHLQEVVERYLNMPVISNMRVRQGNPYAYLGDDGLPDAIVDGVDDLWPKPNVGYVSWDEEIERKVSALHKMIWRYRHSIWPEGIPADPVDLLDPEKAIQYSDYVYLLEDGLGVYREGGVDIEVAGVLDRTNDTVSVSRQFKPSVRRFTAAHELAHLYLHKHEVMHRDRPIDGPLSGRNKTEAEADKFAACFLMPKNLVEKRFRDAFCVKEKFESTENAVFAFGQTDLIESVERCKTVHELARILAKAEYYNGRAIVSLAHQFHVTVETMAIRIGELGLISTDDQEDHF